MRVPTWLPFRLQFYFNGHNLLASKLKKEGTGYVMKENAFLEIDDFEKAQKLSDKIRVDMSRGPCQGDMSRGRGC